jgi:hypothetical protein
VEYVAHVEEQHFALKPDGKRPLLEKDNNKTSSQKNMLRRYEDD